jgi:hypothetical protein
MEAALQQGEEMTERTPHDTVLLDLVQAMGRIEGQTQMIMQEQGNAARSRRETYQALNQIRGDMREVKGDVQDVKGTVETVSARVTAMEPDVTKMKAFRSQIALAVFFVTGVVTGAINLVWIAVTHLGDIKAALREFMR